VFVHSQLLGGRKCMVGLRCLEAVFCDWLLYSIGGCCQHISCQHIITSLTWGSAAHDGSVIVRLQDRGLYLLPCTCSPPPYCPGMG
jgi:hypothetical protein